MDFYMLPMKTLNGFDKFHLGQYRKICRTICKLEPDTDRYCADLIDTMRKVKRASRFFVSGGTDKVEVKNNLAVLYEALETELEDVSVKDFARYACHPDVVKIIEGHIKDNRKSRRNMLEVGYGVEFI
jgi:hypothetical protein